MPSKDPEVLSGGGGLSASEAKFSGYIFEDGNGDGSQREITDPPMSPVTTCVEINCSGSDGSVLMNDSCYPIDANGFYSVTLSGVTTANSPINCAIKPSSTDPSFDHLSDADCNGLVGTDANCDEEINISLNPGDDIPDNNAGYDNEQNGSICGVIFKDDNVSPSLDYTPPSDTALSSVTLELYDASSTLVTTMMTDAAGEYCFLNLPFDTYTVKVDTTSSGLVGLDPNSYDVDGGTLDEVTVGITSGAPNSIANNFGYPEASALGSICGVIFKDDNVSPSLDYTPPSDTALSSVTLELYDASSIQIATMMTDAAGEYCFLNLPFNTYTVKVDTTSSGLVGLDPNSYDVDGGTLDEVTVGITSGTPNSIANNFGYPEASVCTPSTSIIGQSCYVKPHACYTWSADAVSTDWVDPSENYFDEMEIEANGGEYHSFAFPNPLTWTNASLLALVNTELSGAGASFTASSVYARENLKVIDYDSSNSNVKYEGSMSVTICWEGAMSTSDYIAIAEDEGSIDNISSNQESSAVYSFLNQEQIDDCDAGTTDPIILKDTSGTIVDPVADGLTAITSCPVLGSIAGTIFEDDNIADGDYVTIDTPIASAEACLKGTDSNGYVHYLTIPTDAAGEYLFPDLVAGTYETCSNDNSLPSGLNPNSYDNDGDLDNANPVTLGSGQNITNENYGYPVCVSPEPISTKRECFSSEESISGHTNGSGSFCYGAGSTCDSDDGFGLVTDLNNVIKSIRAMYNGTNYYIPMSGISTSNTVAQNSLIILNNLRSWALTNSISVHFFGVFMDLGAGPDANGYFNLQNWDIQYVFSDTIPTSFYITNMCASGTSGCSEAPDTNINSVNAYMELTITNTLNCDGSFGSSNERTGYFTVPYNSNIENNGAFNDSLQGLIDVENDINWSTESCTAYDSEAP